MEEGMDVPTKQLGNTVPLYFLVLRLKPAPGDIIRETIYNPVKIQK